MPLCCKKNSTKQKMKSVTNKGKTEEVINTVYTPTTKNTHEKVHLLIGKNKHIGGKTHQKKRKIPPTNGSTIALDVYTASSSSTEECIAKLRADPLNGLSQAEATRRISFSGYNEFEVKKSESLFGKYLEQFKNPLICLLLSSAIVSIVMKQFDDALSITVAVMIVVTVGIRDGKSVCFYAKELVPGDLVLLNTGDRVPADVRIFESIQLQIDESSFTGENEARYKHSNPVPSCLRTTQVNEVIANGHCNITCDGGIEHLDNIAFMGTLVCSGRGKGIVIGTGANSKFGEVFQLMQSEESPKTPLQKSMDHLGKQLSFYSLGVIGLIFLIGLLQGRPTMDMFTIGVSLAVAAIPEGLPIVVAVTLAIGVMRMGHRKAVVKKLSAVETLGCVTVICSDKTGTLTKNMMTACVVISADDCQAEVTGTGYDPSDGDCRLQDGELVSGSDRYPSIASVIEIGCLCNNAQLANGTVIGQPTEGALMVLAIKTNLDNLSSYLINGNTKIPMTVEKRNQIIQTASGLGQSGLRVIGMARGSDIRSLYYAGLVGIMDPPRPGCRQSIEIVQSAGVSVKMVTGDGLETATSIRLGIHQQNDNCLSGPQIDSLTDFELEQCIRSVTIFYRSSPRHKLRIVKALQNIGEVVAMTGDGVNDAVALKKSDIGVAMGESGTDVCKEASDMVLINDDFSTIKAAIEEGKGIYHNITNFVKFQLSTSVAALSLIAISTIFHFENPLNAMQILWINIIMDGPPAQSLGVENVDSDIIKQPPRNVKEPLINRSLIINIISSATIIISGTLFVFYKEMAADNKITPRDTTMTFTCFVLFDMWNALSCRSSRKMIWEIGFFRNRMFCLALVGSLLCQLAVIYIKPLQHIFQTEALTAYGGGVYSFLMKPKNLFNFKGKDEISKGKIKNLTIFFK
ncbi:Calcium-transporting ATPase [Meloidogyne graminicola]|uniref:P-type Ca(2+) transporter n=1 Tax=Meloidogyne graminicola TaxID=189291 RepID=A0A8T0A184_9BILA|nr:Calcium-transporting ATPase [Meloidogyne graminicola]